MHGNLRSSQRSKPQNSHRPPFFNSNFAFILTKCFIGLFSLNQSLRVSGGILLIWIFDTIAKAPKAKEVSLGLHVAICVFLSISNVFPPNMVSRKKLNQLSGMHFFIDVAGESRNLLSFAEHGSNE